MQTVIYADILIVINAVITFLILLTTSDIIRVNSGKVRFVSGSMIGGLFSFVILAPQMNVILVILTRIVMCIVIVLIAFPIRSVRIMLKCFCGFTVISFLYGGIVFFVSTLVGNGRLIYNNGYAYYNFSIFSLIVVVLVIFFVVKMLIKNVLSKQKQDYIYDTELVFNEKIFRIKAFFDSGNSVKDVYSGKPVIIVSFSQIKDAFSDEDKKIIEKILSGNYSDIGNRMRLLPVKTLGEQKLLPAFSAEKVTVTDNFSYRVIDKPCIAVSSDSFGENNYGALINESVLGKVI